MFVNEDYIIRNNLLIPTQIIIYKFHTCPQRMKEKRRKEKGERRERLEFNKMFRLVGHGAACLQSQLFNTHEAEAGR